MNFIELKELLEEKALYYNRPSFVNTDPIQVPKLFSLKENIEIAGFLSAAIAWGQRPTIIRNAMHLMKLMEGNPYDFLMQAEHQDWSRFSEFRHRTFNGTDLLFFLRSLRNIYLHHGGLEAVFTYGFRQEQSIDSALRYFRKIFFETAHEVRSGKHISDIDKGASAKRLNMFLRWMVRYDEGGVDFGLWRQIPAAALMLPLDVHSGNQARMLGLLKRKQNDWKAVHEVTAALRQFDPSDPVKYDFALFGMGIFE